MRPPAQCRSATEAALRSAAVAKLLRAQAEHRVILDDASVDSLARLAQAAALWAAVAAERAEAT